MLSKKKKIFSGAIFAMAILIAGINLLRVPAITDPNDPKFKPMEFKFENYKEPIKICTDSRQKCESDFGLAIDKMFPRGTKKEFVEKILIAQAGASSETDRSKENCSYIASGPQTTVPKSMGILSCKPWPAHEHRIIYSYKITKSLFETATYIVIATYDSDNNIIEVGTSGGFTSF